MLYQAYQAQADIMTSLRGVAGVALQGFGQLRELNPYLADCDAVRRVEAGYELLGRVGLTHERPPWGIDAVKVGRRGVGPRGGHRRPPLRDPPALPQGVGREAVGAAAEGAGARAAVRALLDPAAWHRPHPAPQQDVWISDWHNARDVGLDQGSFGFDTYVEYVIRWLELLGPDTHVIAVCQPCVAALAATVVMAEAGNPCQPRTLTLMAGPIDTRVDPTVVNDLATSRPLSWFEQNVIASVPGRYAGAGRRVYPGFLQLSSFVSMNLERHLGVHRRKGEGRKDLHGDEESAMVVKAFYDEYFAVLDLTAEFYLETVEYVFQEHRLAGSSTSRAGAAPPGGDPQDRAPSPWRASATTSARPARPSRPTTSARTSARCASATTSSSAWATTACSTAAVGRGRSIPSCTT